jgi:hypothetical protein
MSKLSRILRWAALPLALSMTATLAQAHDTETVCELTPLPSALCRRLRRPRSRTPVLPVSKLGVTFNDSWTFTLPTRINGRCRVAAVGANQLCISLSSGFSTAPIDLAVTIPALAVTGPGGHFSFTGTPGDPVTPWISRARRVLALIAASSTAVPFRRFRNPPRGH